MITMQIYNRKSKTYVEKNESLLITFLYKTFIGRLILKLLTLPIFSKLSFFILNSKFSCIFIKKFVKKYKINLNLFSDTKFKSFNEFFKRSYKNLNFKNINKNDLISICDGKLSYYNINKDLILHIKNTSYSISDILDDTNLANEYANGICLIFRLTPDNCHRYIFFDNGKIISNKKIKGKLHSVKPIALYKIPVFIQNSREISVLNTENFGKVVQVEIGALLIGKISNHIKENNMFNKFEEKGFFEFGGSTICLLFKENVINIDDDIKKNSLKEFETEVHIGEKIGNTI